MNGMVPKSRLDRDPQLHTVRLVARARRRSRTWTAAAAQADRYDSSAASRSGVEKRSVTTPPLRSRG